MDESKKRYDRKHKVTRVFLNDYLALKRMSLAAGVSMAEALHRLIEHQAQLPMLDMAVKPMPAFRFSGVPAAVAFRVAPVITGIAVNGAGARHSAFVIKPKGGVRYG